MTTLLWFNRDLRLTDNPALQQALALGQPVIPVFIWDEANVADGGGASKWWLHHSLTALDTRLKQLGSRLIVARGATVDTLEALARQTQAEHLVFASYFSPRMQTLHSAVKLAFEKASTPCRVHITAPNLLCDVINHKNQQGKPYQVFSVFWRTLGQQGIITQPTPAPSRLPSPDTWPDSLSIESLGLLPTIPWDAQFYTYWQPSELNAQKALAAFLNFGIDGYAHNRNLPYLNHSTSRLSPFLHFGELSIADVWHQIREWVAQRPDLPKQDVDCFLSELGWREFCYYLLHHFPHTAHQPLRPEFQHFPWQSDETLLNAWKRGETGYPIVDAGMRQLWTMGWMHNRVRMIVASFLVKHLLQPWQEGAAWFMDTLVDADEASNAFGWQWSAGSGADASPYFRIFNPVLQGQKFDPEGRYVKHWIPALANLPAKAIHQPWIHQPWLRGQAASSTIYPAPVVDHAIARLRALEAFKHVKQHRAAV